MKTIRKLKNTKTRRNYFKNSTKNLYKKKIGGKQNQKLRKINCSPKPKDELNDFSCYTNKSLIELRDRWNARHPDVKINTNSPKEIHNKISEILKDICNNEACWLRQNSEFGKLESELSESFAPESPPEWKKNPNEWLSSTDIIKVMRQYEKAYKCFDFIGPSPIDFDTRLLYGECVWEELCNFNLEKLIKKGKTKIGIVFNTDAHNKPGQHWISMFINIKTKKIFFFDSTGNKMPHQVKTLIKRIKNQGFNMNPKINFKVDSNEGIEHQYGNTECGIYSIFFIVHMLQDKMTEHYLKTHILKDEYMQEFRHIYFNNSL
jgi:Txe/YoeB family toxin of Txe-Axe toxin-antitoxin module